MMYLHTYICTTNYATGGLLTRTVNINAIVVGVICVKRITITIETMVF